MRLTVEQQRLVEEHIGLADRIAIKWWWRFDCKDKDDIRSSSYLGLCIAAASPCPPDKFEQSARTICRNVIISDRRAWMRRKTKCEKSECVSDRMLENLIIQEQISLLPPQQQRLIKYRLWGHEIAEAASEMAISVSTAKKHSMWATQRLRHQLA